MNHFVVKHEVKADFLVIAVQDALDVRKKHNPAWVSEGAESLADQLLDLVENCGVGNSSSPFDIVDNYLINGEFISREEWEEKDKKEGETFEEWANENCILHNDDFACRSF